MTARKTQSNRRILQRPSLSTLGTRPRSLAATSNNNVIDFNRFESRKHVKKTYDFLHPIIPPPNRIPTAVSSRNNSSQLWSRSNDRFLLPSSQDSLLWNLPVYIPAKTIQKVRTESLPYFVEQVHSTHPYVPGVCGLKNLGNTCFMNSALQCLSNIPDLTDEVVKRCSVLPKDNNNILYAYTSLIQKMWSGDNEVADPKDIKRLVGRSFPIFADYSQKDAHEFMNSLLNMMEETGWSQQIHRLFHIQTKSQVTCNLKQCVYSIDESNNFLPLPLSKETLSQTGIPLVKLIEEFTMEEPLQGSYYCQHCDKYVSAKQQTTISSLP